MVKIIGPGLSLSAKGSIGKTLTFQKRPSGHAIYPYSKPGSREPFESSPKQKDQRGIIGLITARWQCMTPAQKQVWEDEAKTIGFQGSGYHLFLHTAQKDLTKYLGLVGYWSFNYNVGDKVLDLSGKGNHGTLKPTYPSDCPLFKDSINKKFGKCLSFDGVNDYVRVPYNSVFDLTTKLTIEAWVKRGSGGDDEQLYIGRAWQYFMSFWLKIIKATNKVQFSFATWPWTEYIVTSNGTIPIGERCHIAVTFDKPNFHFYINGKDDGLKNFNYTLPITSVVLFLGAHLNTFYFQGSLDEVRLYNRALGADEILKLFQLFCR